MRFGKLLRKLRTKRGLGIKQLGPDVNLSYTYISKLENSKVAPSPEVIRRLSDYFDYSADELMLAAGKIPDDVASILRDNPEEAIAFLREKFGRNGNG